MIKSYYPIIGIAGKAGSGKTEAANYIKNRYKADIIALADPIKDFLFQSGCSEEALYGPSELRNTKADICYKDPMFYINCKILARHLNIKEPDRINELHDHLFNNGSITIRQALQWLGTEWGRRIDPNIWINYGLNTAKNMLTNKSNLIIISDLRFRGEILGIKEVGGFIINIERGIADDCHNHVSETELDSVPDFWYDAHIYNTGTIKKLHDNIDDIMEHLYGY